MSRAPGRTYARALLIPALIFASVISVTPASADPDRAPASTGYLLPLPSTSVDDSGSTTPPEEVGEGDSVTVESPETVDEAIALLKQTEEAQAVADSVASTLASAEVELASARTLEAMAIEAALETQAPVAEAEERIGVLAAQQYMSGGLPNWAALLYAETPRDAVDVATYATYMSSVSNTYIADIERAQFVATAAQLYAEQSTQKRVALEQRVADLENNLAAAQLTISTSIAAYQAYISQPGPQTRVGPDGCPLEVPSGALRGGSEAIGVTELCRRAVAEAASPQAALAIKTAFNRLGAPYACEGVGRLGAWRFDCSSLVSRAYSESSGIPVAGASWAPSTRNMMPWDGESLDPHYVEVQPDEVRPGDLLLYRSCSTPPCDFQHVQMALTDGFILHTNDCGDIAHITLGSGYGPGSDFVVARRVVHIEGEDLLTPIVTFPGSPPDPSTYLTKRQLEELQARQATIKSPGEPTGTRPQP